MSTTGPRKSPAKRSVSGPGGTANTAATLAPTGPNSSIGRRSTSPASSQSVGNQQRPTNPSGAPKPRSTTGGSSQSQTPPSQQGTMPTPPAIPFKENDLAHKAHRQIYKDLIQLVTDRKGRGKPRIFVFTDTEQDYDDMLAIIFLAEMHRMGAIELVGFIANYTPADERAKFLRSVLHLLGLGKVPVAAGTIGQPGKGDREKYFYELKNKTFREQSWNNRDEMTQNSEGKGPAELLIDSVLSANRPVTALMLSSLQDIGEFFTRKEKAGGNFKDRNFAKLVSQGGYTVEKDQAPAAGNANGTAAQQKGANPAQQAKSKPKPPKVILKPVGNMRNNQFNEAESKHYCNTLAKYRLTSDTWSREAAMASRLPGSFMRQLFQYGPIGAHLRWMWMRMEFKFFWDPFNWRYLPQLDVDWYVKGRLGLTPGTDAFNKKKKELEANPSFSSIVDDIKVIAYDCCAAVGAVGDDFMRQVGVLKELSDYNQPEKTGHPHRVFGMSPTDQGGIDTDRLRLVMETFMLGGLMMTAGKAEKIIASGTVQHESEPARLDMAVFKQKIEMRKKADLAKEYRAEAANANTKPDKKLQLLNAAKAADEKAAAIMAKVGAGMPSRDDIPYEQLYQEEMAAAARKRK